jgi:hypothetical protein
MARSYYYATAVSDSTVATVKRHISLPWSLVATSVVTLKNRRMRPEGVNESQSKFFIETWPTY